MKDEIYIDQNDVNNVSYTRKNNISIEKTIVKLGYKDIINVQNMIRYQKSEMEKIA